MLKLSRDIREVIFNIEFYTQQNYQSSMRVKKFSDTQTFIKIYFLFKETPGEWHKGRRD